MDTSTRIVDGIIGFLCQGQHRLICSLVVLDIGAEQEPMLQSIIEEILDCLLQLGGKHVFSP